MGEPVDVGGVVAALSVVSDLARGHPSGEAMRACLVATELARRAGLEPPRQSDVYYGTLLRFAGCSATSHELAALLGGDDMAIRGRGDLVDASRPGEALRFAAFLASRGEGVERLAVWRNLPRVASARVAGARADCEVGADLTRRLRLPETVRRAVLDSFERFDGRGIPAKRAAADIAEASRFAAVGYAAVMFDAVESRDDAIRSVTRWSGRALDPDIVVVFQRDAEELMRVSDPEDTWQAVVAAEPQPRRAFPDDDSLDEALAAYGDAADLKSPWFTGHSRGVAGLARVAAERLGRPTAADVYRAGLVHDLGRVAVPTGVWERETQLRPADWELVRLHPYYSGRLLAPSPVLEPLARLASRHHERADGSGYPASVRAPDLDVDCSLLAAADVFHAMREDRPHRPARDAKNAARMLSATSIDRDAIGAVLDAAGESLPLPRPPAGITERELQILRLLVAGRTERQIATELGVSPSTVHTHTMHIYEKSDVSTRAGLAMFAMQHGLTKIP